MDKLSSAQADQSDREGPDEPPDEPVEVDIAPLTETDASPPDAASENATQVDPDSELESFRHTWKEELRGHNTSGPKSVSKAPQSFAKTDNLNTSSTFSDTNANTVGTSSSGGQPINSGNVNYTGYSRRKLAPVPEKCNRGSTEEDSNGNSAADSSSTTMTAMKTAYLQRQAEMNEEEKEKLARNLYISGTELERAGELYRAIKQYKKALQLVPDIERKHFNWCQVSGGTDHDDNNSGDDEGEQEREGDGTTGTDDGGDSSLLTQLALYMSPNAPVCQPEWPQQAPHLRCLPREILEHVLRWVIGSELDTRSLHALSATCRGLYCMVTQHQQLWRLACQRVWGRDLLSLDDTGSIDCQEKSAATTGGELTRCSYNNWREMFLRRPQPRYNGVYVGKTSYFRSGECNFHDQNYQPWHLVTYYRLIRLFPGGCALMLTTSEHPQAIVHHLSNRECKHTQVVEGKYSLKGNAMELHFTRRHINDRQAQQVKRRHSRQMREFGTTDIVQTDFNMTLELQTSRRGDINWVLQWRRYSITCRSVQAVSRTSDIELQEQQDNFPPLVFSRVKSYTRDSRTPLG